MTPSHSLSGTVEDKPARKPLRICMLAYAYYDNDNRIIRYAESLVRRGDQVDVLCIARPGDARHTRINGVDVYRLQHRTRNERGPLGYLLRMLLFCMRSAVRLCRTEGSRRYDIIHVHNIPDFLVFAAWPAKRYGARVILDIHDLLPEFYCSKFAVGADTCKRRILLWVERRAVSFADHVIVSNDIWRERLAHRCFAQRKCTTIINYVDLHLFSRQPRARRDDRWIIVYAGGLYAHQGLKLMITALSAVRQSIPTAEIHIYGEGPESAQLAAESKRLGISDRVFLRAPIPIQEIPGILADADVGVVPKLAESFGNEAYSTKILELMSQGVPVIVSATQIDLHYFPATTVCFFKSGDAADLARSLQRIKDEEPYRTALVREADAFVASNSWSKKVGLYFEIVDTLAAKDTKCPAAT